MASEQGCAERGEPVQDNENLWRAIVQPKWWNTDEDRPSSGIFSHKKFSAFVESLMASDHPMRFLPQGGGC